MSIAVVTVNWNRWQLTQRCIASVRKARDRGFHIYVVDNASTDDSLEHLSGSGPNVTLIAHPVNSGWAGGNNVGVSCAQEDGHEFILLLNNDAQLVPDALDALLEAHDRLTATGVALAPVLGAIERHADGGFGFLHATTDPVTGIPGWGAGMIQPELAGRALIPTDYVHGAALFAHRSVFEHVGPFDERFFLCFDETDWCFRARRAGHPLFVVRGAAIIHEGGATMGGFRSVLHTYFMTRNCLLFAELHCTPQQRAAVLRRHREEAQACREAGRTLDVVFRRATLDYKARRFGDCPPFIRALGREPAGKGTHDIA